MSSPSMALKRKRSMSELTSSPSSVSSFNSPPRAFEALSNPFAAMAATPIHLHSRTMKRFRNNKPSEEQVHERTLNLLYSAQNQIQDDRVMSHPEQMHMQQPSRPETQQQSLHRFWKIASAPTSSLCAPTVTRTMMTSNCDDCGTGLEDGMGAGEFDHACGACGKQVCFSCSVSNLGEQRRCLHCAGRKTWTGASFWPGSGIST